MEFKRGDRVICIDEASQNYGCLGRFVELYEYMTNLIGREIVVIKHDRDERMIKGTQFYTKNIQHVHKAKIDLLNEP